MDATQLSADLNARYNNQLNCLQVLSSGSVEGRYVTTALGPVWVLEAGPKDGPPLIALHGLHTPGPFNLEFFWSLAQNFRVISPDIPGQAGKTPGIAPLPAGQAYAMWLDQLMDELAIDACPMVGLSFGAAILLDMAAYKPERINRASLVVPAGFFRPLWRPLKQLVMPFLGFKLHTDQLHFDQLMKPLMGENWPELERYYYSVFEAGIPMTLIPPGPFAVSDLSRFSAPVQLIYAQDDLYFDPDKLLKKAMQALPSIQEHRLINDLHVPSEQNRLLIQDDVLGFMRNKTGI